MSTFDSTNKTYTITGFDSQNNPVVMFSCDGHSEALTQCPTDNADNTKAFLDTYVDSYIAGKLQEQSISTVNSIAPSVQSLVGQAITAPVDHVVLQEA